MSRKSRKHVCESRKRNLQNCICAMILLGLCILAGAGLIWRAANTETISREEAIPVKATFQQATEEWKLRSKWRRYRRTGMYLTFSDHDEMEIDNNLDAVAVAEELPYTDKRRRPVLLAELSSGMVCVILADPQEPDKILHLETEDGTVIVSFEASMETRERARKNGYIFGGVFVGAGLLGGLWALFMYATLMRKHSGKG